MNLPITNREGNRPCIELPETFNYAHHRDFKSTYTPLLDDNNVRELELDFRRTNYLDSAALGMLLMLRKAAEGAGKPVTLANARGTVRDVLDIAHFQTLFAMK